MKENKAKKKNESKNKKIEKNIKLKEKKAKKINENNTKKSLLILGTLSLIIILLGSAYAFFTYFKSHEAFAISSLNLRAEFISGTNSVTFQNAYPISDAFALANLDKLTYVDFTVTSEISNDKQAVEYEIYLTEEEGNTLDSSFVKVYLTDDNNNSVAGPRLYANLSNTSFNGAEDGKVIYKDNNTGTFSKNYRLYIWLDSSYEQNEVSQSFKFKVNLYATDSENKSLSYLIENEVKNNNTGSCKTYIEEDGIIYISGSKDCIDFNYILFSDKLWRITAIYPDGSLKLITEDIITTNTFGSNSNFYTNENTNSSIYQWLNSEFIKNLYNYENIIKTDSMWNITTGNGTVNYKLPETAVIPANVGLFNSYEYSKSYENLGDSENGYLNKNSLWWLSNPYNSSGSVWSVDANGVATSLTPSSNAGVRPSIIMKYPIKIDGGAGTKNDPYKITTIKHCANFHLNGALKINDIPSNLSNVCCVANSEGVCTVTSPTITPAENYEVLGWNESSKSTTISQNVFDDEGNSAEITLNGDKNLYAITVSSEETLKTYSLEFNLNGADSYTLQENATYTTDETFTCKTDYTYNGAPINDYCSFTLPKISRSEGTVYGWDSDSLNHGTPSYKDGETIKVYEDLTLNAITSTPVTLSFNANGGTTTIDSIVGQIYNTDVGADFIIPNYDNQNMCRTATNYTNFSKGSFKATGYLLGYKYIGLTDSSTSKTVEYCPGNYIYLEEDTTLYAVWNEDYATTRVTSGNQLNLRSGCGTNYAATGTSMNSSTLIYVKSEGATYSSGYMGYWVKYGEREGCGSSMYLQNFLSYPEYNSCDRTDYVCNGGTASDVTMTPDTVTLNLKKSDQLSANIEVDSRCGTYSLSSSDTSVATVSKVSGNTWVVNAVSGGVAENQRKTVTITATASWGCTATTEVVVKNSDDIPPTINITMNGETYSNGYKSGVVASVTCNANDGIATFNVSDNKSKTFTTEGDNYAKTATATYSGGTSSWTITATCTSVNDITSTVTKSYKIYTYSKSSACGVSSYSYSGTCKCTSSAMTSTWLVTKACNSSVYSYGSCKSYCSGAAGLPVSSGSCSRTTNYKTCWHT